METGVVSTMMSRVLSSFTMCPLIALILLSLLAHYGEAAVILNLATGLNASGALATVDQTFDPNWTVNPQAGGPVQQAEILFPQDPDWFYDGVNSYVDDGPSSNWITRNSLITDNGYAPYSFNRTFMLSADVNMSSVSIQQGNWSIADGGSIVLNGVVIASAPDGNDGGPIPWNHLMSFDAPAGQALFIEGVNLLQLVITGADDQYEAARMEGFLTYTLLSSAVTAASSTAGVSSPSSSTAPVSSSAVPFTPSSSAPVSSSTAPFVPSSTAAVSSSAAVFVSSSSAPPSVRGDPQFIGLLGQSFQVHGIDGAVYNLISDPALQLNARFAFLNGPRPCPVMPISAKVTACWSHPGSYLSELGLQVRDSGDEVFIGAGSASTGFAVVSDANGRLAVGQSTGSDAVTLLSTHELRIRAGSFVIEVENVDGFVNLRSVEVTTSLSRLRSHGLLGQTWMNKRYKSSLRVIDGEVDDYLVIEHDVFGTHFLFNQYAETGTSEL